jgi:phenylacetate-coenzyme A ligase PaaK-like adenylate-forming protein
LVAVLRSRTLPLIRYELSDSVRLAPPGPCPCGRPYARIEAIQGRQEESLTLTGLTGGPVTAQSGIFHRVMDLVAVAEWQVVRDQDADALTVLAAGQGSGFAPEDLRARLRGELERLGAVAPAIHVDIVDKVPVRHSAGRRSSARHRTNRPWWARVQSANPVLGVHA